METCVGMAWKFNLWNHPYFRFSHYISTKTQELTRNFSTSGLIFLYVTIYFSLSSCLHWMYYLPLMDWCSRQASIQPLTSILVCLWLSSFLPEGSFEDLLWFNKGESGDHPIEVVMNAVSYQRIQIPKLRGALIWGTLCVLGILLSHSSSLGAGIPQIDLANISLYSLFKRNYVTSL